MCIQIHFVPEMKCVYCGKGIDKGEGMHRSFHRFPIKRPRELQSWLKNLGLQDNKQPLKFLRLCSDHFSNECFVRENGTITLRQGSIPTLFHASKQKKCIYCHMPKTDNRTFHKFPLQHSAQLCKWLSGIPLQNFFPTKDAVLCSDHFELKCFRRVKNKLRLKELMVPTIFKPVLLTEINVSSSKLEATTSIEESVSAIEMKVIKNVETVEIVKSGPEIKTTAESETAADVTTEAEMGTSAEIETNTDLETTADLETAKNVRTDVEMETIIDVNCTRDMALSSLIPSTSKSNRQKKRPNIPVSSGSLWHDHHYENSPRTLKRQLALVHDMKEKQNKMYKISKQRVNQLRKKIKSLKDVVRTLRQEISILKMQLVLNEYQKPCHTISSSTNTGCLL